ncbi:histidine kinase [Paenibacillus macerans]|uniref:cache domain-containing sensor histidine kinase n=1 Tax=Paenibacillus macerans TaxID=44252 RepID=UPI000ECA10E3|nr:sensor histidine kinase [Paenibacillus macerans]MBS5911171.1 histidine kinase [Paenibacillus macerans]MDU5945645.1 histidine kinase [Paenibacillus macerans]MEC0137583.1 histidine kinase [Paenibacillus macerans]GBK66019.1 sensor histidine kinase YesM [Paenibacillus macerans]GBK72346.1 sensor histidine kinase YesM [Paenibacillus macerans]
MLIRNVYLRLSVKWKVILIFTSLLVFMSGLFIIGFNYINKLYDRQLLHSSSELLNLYSTNIENELRKIENMTFTFLTENNIQTDLVRINESGSSYEKSLALESFRQTLLAAAQSETYISSVSYFTLDGGEITVGNSVTPFAADYLRTWFADLRELNGGIRWEEPLNGDQSFVLARQIRRVNNLKPLGFIVIRIHPRLLMKWIADTWPNYEGRMTIMGADNRPIYVDPRVELSALSLERLIHRKYDVQTIKSDKYLLTQLSSSSTGWSYVNLVPYKSIFKTIQAIRTGFIGVFALLLVVLLAVGVKFASAITKPLILLSKQMRRTQSGEFGLASAMAPPPETGDEIGQLRRDFAVMVHQIDTLIKENYIKQLRIKEAEIKALQSQMNPHFLYNTLQSIQWEAELNRQAKIAQMVKALGMLLRRSTSTQEHLTTLREEMEMLDAYLMIQKYRYEERLFYVKEIDPAALEAKIMKMSLQPLVEK